ncbi:MAG: DNA internalization-related competence protein ComEC/Rec2, partial [Gammaproteobacteria bacterium HGW-Gammaproteobacteria-5]
MVASCLLLGVLPALRLPLIPPSWLLVLVLGFGMWAWLRGRVVMRVLGAVAVGFAWALIQAQGAMSVRLPSSLQGHDLQVQGRVIDLPEQRADGVRFMLRIDAGEPA